MQCCAYPLARQASPAALLTPNPAAVDLELEEMMECCFISKNLAEQKGTQFFTHTLIFIWLGLIY